MNGYNISASIEPVLMNYIDMRMDFVAVRLRGTAGIQRMAPLKITMPGMQAVLPLQMVAAGVSEKVGLLLMVLGNSRYEAANFPNFVVENANLTYDFSARTDGMAAFRAESRRLDQIAGGGWQTESALPQDRSQLERFARAYPQSPPGPDGMSASVQADVITALAGIDGPLMLTRLRAELPTSALTRDLRLQASAANTLSSRYEFGAALNTPVPAACEPLRCAENWGRIETDGAINDPFNRVVAPSSTFPGRYTAGSLPAYSPRVTRVEPARLPPIREQCNSVGRAVAQPTGVGGGGCAVGAVSKSRSTSCMFAFGLVLCASAASRRKRA